MPGIRPIHDDLQVALLPLSVTGGGGGVHMRVRFGLVLLMVVIVGLHASAFSQGRLDPDLHLATTPLDTCTD